MWKKLIFAKSKSAFERALNDGKISHESIVFIEDIGGIWTHGVYFGTNSSTRVEYGEWDFRDEPDMYADEYGEWDENNEYTEYEEGTEENEA